MAEMRSAALDELKKIVLTVCAEAVEPGPLVAVTFCDHTPPVAIEAVAVPVALANTIFNCVFPAVALVVIVNT